MNSFRLIILSGVDAGRDFPLEKIEIIIGRNPAADLDVNDPDISRQHARLSFQNAGFIIEDLGSSFGTFVEGQKISGPYKLNSGEVIHFGTQATARYESTEIGQSETVPPDDPTFELSAPTICLTSKCCTLLTLQWYLRRNHP